MKIMLCQINPTVGDIEGNISKILFYYNKAAEQNADIAVFPELAICGYSPEDLVLRPGFQDAVMAGVKKLALATTGMETAMVVGGIPSHPSIEGSSKHLNIQSSRNLITNSLFLLSGGEVKFTQNKWALPNYGVFDEKRVFAKGELPKIHEFNGMRLALIVCEDMWRAEVQQHVAEQNPDIIISINASPYEIKKRHMRTLAAESMVKQCNAPLIYVNQVGGQDELVFDGNSFVMDAGGEIVHNLPGFEEFAELVEFGKVASDQWLVASKGDGLQTIDESSNHRVIQSSSHPTSHQPLATSHLATAIFRPFPGTTETIYSAMILGLRDYVNKNGFKGVVLGLSGGIDSALSVAIAVDALGADRVHGLLLPSKYTSESSIADALESAKLLSIKTDIINIEPTVEAVRTSLGDAFKGLPEDATEENIQSRARAILVMAISNKFGFMVLTTGNKSEMSVGYATLYGDLCGGYSVLKDVYKTTVYELANWRNENIPKIALGKSEMVIPKHSITRVPSAELKPNQTDQDSLPPYDVLDEILKSLIEEQKGIQELVAEGFDEATVKRIAGMLYSAEYKRRQSPPGVKISNMAFGRDRRYPITNKFRE